MSHSHPWGRLLPVPHRAWPRQAGAGTSPSPCLQVLLFLQDALNPDMCFNISAVSGGGRRQHSPESFPQVSLSYRSCLMGLGSSHGLCRADGGFSSVRGPPVWICPDLLVRKTEQLLAGDKRPSGTAGEQSCPRHIFGGAVSLWTQRTWSQSPWLCVWHSKALAAGVGVSLGQAQDPAQGHQAQTQLSSAVPPTQGRSLCRSPLR